MRKLNVILLVLLMMGTTAVSAQRFTSHRFGLPIYQTPANQTIANYQTYSLYVFWPTAPANPGFSINGFYNVVDESILRKDEVNADLKMLFEVRTIQSPARTVRGDTLRITSASVEGYLWAFDKEGNQIHRRYARISNPTGYVLESDVGIGLSSQLMQALMHDVLRRAVSDFIEEHFVTTRIIRFRDNAPTFANLFRGVNNYVRTAAQTDEITQVQTPAEMLDIARRQLGFWQTFADYPATRDNQAIRTAAFYNLALFNYLLGNVEASQANLAAMSGTGLQNSSTRETVTSLNNFKANHTYRVMSRPVLKGPFTHASNVRSSVSTESLIDNILYYVIDNATITLTDGTTHSGRVKVRRRERTADANRGQIVSLNRPEFEVRIINAEGTENTTLRQVDTIRTSERTFIADGNALLKPVFVGNRISLYEVVVTNLVVGVHRYRKPGGELTSPPIVRRDRWFRQFFSNCPALVAKVSSGELSDPIDIARFYENCQ